MSKAENTRSGSTTDSPLPQSYPPDDLINRRTEYRFAGHGLKLDLSLGLFSSAGVDTGSMLLLKTLAKEFPLENLSRALDVGCGVGTLGLAIAARCPEAKITMVDRDALAVAFTRHNAGLNSLKNVSADTRLMTEGPHEGTYDLVMSNFPAKAGDPVLEDYLERSLSLLSSEGRGALVIVHTLADRCRELLAAVGSQILLEDSSKQHTVFHYKPSDSAESGDPSLSLKPYIRHSGNFSFKRTGYKLDTVWNIGDFDSHSWGIKLMGDMLDAAPPRKGTLVFWNPGQGHLPVAAEQRGGSSVNRIILAGRDRLSLLISGHNLKDLPPGTPVTQLSLADIGLLPDALETTSVDFLLTDLRPVPRSDWAAGLRKASASIVRKDGLWAILGRSSDVAALTKISRGWTPVADRRNKGVRAVLFRKN